MPLITAPLGPFYIKYAGGNCNPSVYLTAATGQIITDYMGQDDRQLWLLYPILQYTGTILAGWRLSLNSNQTLALQGAAQGPLTTAPFQEGKAEFVWTIIPSKNRADCCNILCYNYHASGGPLAMDVQDHSCAPRTTVQGIGFKDNGAQQFQIDAVL